MGGTDKAHRVLGGLRLYQYPLDILRRRCTAVVISANEPSGFAGAGVPVLPDDSPGRGPLGGLATALLRAPCPTALVLTCDMPFVGDRLLDELLIAKRGYPAVHARTASRAYPFPLVLDTRLHNQIEYFLKLGRSAVRDFLREAGAGAVDLPEGCERDLFNVNTPEDLKEAERLCQLQSS